MLRKILLAAALTLSFLSVCDVSQAATPEPIPHALGSFVLNYKGGANNKQVQNDLRQLHLKKVGSLGGTEAYQLGVGISDREERYMFFFYFLNSGNLVEKIIVIKLPEEPELQTRLTAPH